MIIVCYSLPICAQISIGKTSITNDSVLLEFGTDPKGILLPWVTNTSAVTGAVPGTMIFDISDKKVKYFRGGASSTWVDLSIDTSGVVDTSLQNSLTEVSSAKVIMGANSSSAPGILVLESSNKAMVLPKVASPHLNIINPSPGMIAYDTAKKQLAVFNGSVWSFWKY
ncbi:hypothetical protein CHRYSEOSP005_24860 [Chryseobacterium sp. Alg-005]|uniref:hypothetical protein n=1 Tax=Chryseobacterium sp. Alg-005 TaxID=3159516 RepID=UPI003555702B